MKQLYNNENAVSIKLQSIYNQTEQSNQSSNETQKWLSSSAVL